MTELKKIGFEIEGEWSQGAKKVMRQYGFQFKGDGSVHNCDGSEKELRDNAALAHAHYSLETAEAVTSPINYDHKSVKYLSEIFAALQMQHDTYGFHFNKSAGFHVHTSYTQFPSEIMSARFFAYFIKKYSKKFPKEYAMRQSNSFCKIPKACTNSKLLAPVVDYKAAVLGGDRRIAESDRYKAINIKGAWNSHKTIEFRIFPSCEPLRMVELLVFTLDTINEFLAKDQHAIVFKEKIGKAVGSRRVKIAAQHQRTDIKRTYIYGEELGGVYKFYQGGRIPDQHMAHSAETHTIMEEVVEVVAIPTRHASPIVPKTDDCPYCFKRQCECHTCACCEVIRPECECDFCRCCDNCENHDNCVCRWCDRHIDDDRCCNCNDDVDDCN